MNSKFNFESSDNIKEIAIRTIAMARFGENTECTKLKDKTGEKVKIQSESKNEEENYDELDCEIDKVMYMLQSYPCLRNNIKSYLPILKKKVIGQDKVLEKLIYVAYYNQYLNFLEEYTEDDTYKRQSMFLIAPTGWGKSTMLRALEKAFDVPVYRANITAITSAGYIGDKLESMLLSLYKRANEDIVKAERGILLIDEIDKKVTSKTTDKDVAGKAVQQELLKLFDRGVINLTLPSSGIKEQKIEFHTGNLTVIFAGACVGLDEIRKKRLNPKQKIGFTTYENEEENDIQYTTQDLIEYGFIPELVGRIDIIQEFEPYTKNKLIDIIYFADESSMQAHVRILKSLGVENITIDAVLWERIAIKILESKLGVRELNNIMGKLFYPIIYEAFQHSSEGSCIIDYDGNYTLTYKKEKKEFKGKCIEFKDIFDEQEND